MDVAGRRVLDIGAASGGLSFHMEQRGAEIVSYDLSERHSWDTAPYSGIDLADVDAVRRRHIRAINNGYWLAHAAFGSRARMVHGTAYAIPEAIGPVDVAVFGALLLHLRDPFRALHNGLRLARETAVVTELLPRRYRYLRWLGPRLAGRFGLPMMLLPRYRTFQPVDGWWILPPAIVQESLGVLGFAEFAGELPRAAVPGPQAAPLHRGRPPHRPYHAAHLLTVGPAGRPPRSARPVLPPCRGCADGRRRS